MRPCEDQLTVKTHTCTPMPFTPPPPPLLLPPVCVSGNSSWLRLSAAEGELSQTNLAIQRQLEGAADTWGRQMAELQASCEQRMAGGWTDGGVGGWWGCCCDCTTASSGCAAVIIGCHSQRQRDSDPRSGLVCCADPIMCSLLLKPGFTTATDSTCMKSSKAA